MKAKQLIIEGEQTLFEEQLPDLMKTHAGEWVLFHGGEPVGFFQNSASAYDAGIEQFDLDVVFLVARVEERVPRPVSVSWELGVMFG